MNDISIICLAGLPDRRSPRLVELRHRWTVQTFDFDGDVEITANRGDESITLDYDDHSDIATISVDRNDVPAGGQVHITISDFQLNLDPTADDAWTLMRRISNVQQCYMILKPRTYGPSSIDFDGSNGVLGLADQNENMAIFENDNKCSGN